MFLRGYGPDPGHPSLNPGGIRAKDRPDRACASDVFERITPPPATRLEMPTSRKIESSHVYANTLRTFSFVKEKKKKNRKRGGGEEEKKQI